MIQQLLAVPSPAGLVAVCRESSASVTWFVVGLCLGVAVATLAIGLWLHCGGER